MIRRQGGAGHREMGARDDVYLVLIERDWVVTDRIRQVRSGTSARVRLPGREGLGIAGANLSRRQGEQALAGGGAKRIGFLGVRLARSSRPLAPEGVHSKAKSR